MKTLEQLGISPAPWKHTPADEWTHAGIDDANSGGVGETYQVARRDETAETANACICAAAPELYEALAAMLSCAEKEAPFTSGSGMPIAMDMARKALAKAAGES